MATHSWVHLACHAIQERTEPAGSGFALWDGVLTIADLSGQPTQQRGLAFLSACQTASGSTRHPDESIHPAAAMQFLGYRHVVASLWILADNPAASVTEAFYTALGPSDEPGSARVARAVHEAVHTLREAEPTNPLIWAPYIHLGI
jgi:CHAT domain-containing protein